MLADRPRWLSYMAAAGLIALATVAKAVADHVLRIDSVFAFYMFAVAVAAWALGRGPGWLGVLLAGLAYDFYFFKPNFHLGFRERQQAVQLLLFMCVAGGITEVLRFAVRTRHAARAFSREAQRMSQVALETQLRMYQALGAVTEPFAMLSAIRDASGGITDFRIDYMNEAGMKTMRRANASADAQTGRPLSELSPAYRELGVFENYVKLVETGGTYHDEICHRRPGATEDSWTEINASKLYDGIVVQWRDTTSRHQAEEALRRSEMRFRRLYDSNQLGVMFYSAEGRISDPNDAFLQIIGHTREQFNLEGLDWRKITPPGWEEVDRVNWEKLRKHGQCGPFEKEYLRRDGTRVPVLISGANLEPDDYEHGVACVVDLSRSKRVEEQLRHSQSSLLALTESLEIRVKQRTVEAEMRSQQLRALALDLAETESRERKRLAKLLHDHFQQLISAAKLKAGLIRRGVKEEKLIDSLRQIESLLEEAITASRSLATELSPPVLSDGGLLPALEWISRKMEKDYGLQVHVKSDPAAEPESEQVRTLVFECVRELLFNIVKHADTHEANLQAHLSPEGLLVIEIRDQGKGFDLQNAMNRSVTAGQDGSFGLFSIRERLSLIGGLLNITSQPGEGTHVELSVPVGLKKESVPLEPAAIIASDGQSGAAFVTSVSENGNGKHDPSRPARVLVADDHRLFREGLINLLAQEPSIVVVGEAADGQEAVDLCRKLKPDVLICDVTMPRLNGVQVAKQVSAEFPEVRVIGLSMHEREDMAHAMRAAGAVAYVTKSGPSDQLLNVLKSVACNQPLESIQDVRG